MALLNPKFDVSTCFVETFSLTPRFNAVDCKCVEEKLFKQFFSPARFNTQLKQGVNENLFYRAVST
jgi:hypothetical protein